MLIKTKVIKHKGTGSVQKKKKKKKKNNGVEGNEKIKVTKQWKFG